MAETPEGQSGSIEERSDLGDGDAALYAYYMGQEKIAEREERKWIRQSRRIVQRYRDERPELAKDTNRFNVLWSNVQTLIPTLYARTPKADVERRFRDDDPVARLAATLLERCITYSADHFDFDDMMVAVTEDRLLPGRGVGRVLYIPHFGEKISSPPIASPSIAPPQGEGNAEFEAADAAAAKVDSPGDEAEPLREVVYEEVRAAYVFWEDYREGPARKWLEVPWVRYRSFLSKEELIKRFGKAKAEKVTLDFTPKGATGSENDGGPPDILKKAIVFEFWDKTKERAIWLAPGTPDLILDQQDDPLKLPGFYPNPNPCLATTTNDKRIPVPDYVEYQDQARELDNLTTRIDVLTKALAVKGIYPGENKQVLQQLFDTGDNQLIPVEDWMAFSNNGGLKDIIQWLPIQQVAETLIQLYNARDRVKNILYEITGLSDILRGMTAPDETLGAQELKANFSTRRITPQQKSIARFARDMYRLMGGVVAEHFSAKTISDITGYPQLKPVPELPQPPNASVGVKVGALLSKFANDLVNLIPGARALLTSFSGMVMQLVPASEGEQAQSQTAAYQQAMAAYQQQVQQVQAIVAENQQKQQQFDAAVDLIKKDGAHGFRIDIEADSTIAPDEQAEKKSRTEFLREIVPFMENVVPFCQGNPAMSELGKELILFGVRGWRVARPLEETIEKAFAAIAQMPPNPKASGQDGKQAAPQQGPDMVDAAVKAHATETDAAVKVKTSDNALQIARENNATTLMVANQSAQAERDKLAAEIPFKHAEVALESARIQNQDDAERLRAQTIAQRGAKSLE